MNPTVNQAPITYGIIGIAVVVFLLSKIGFDQALLSALIFTPLEQDGPWVMVGSFQHTLEQPWRLLTPMFLHFSWMHLIFNALAIFIFMPHVERCFGQSKAVIGVLAASVISNCAEYFVPRWMGWDVPEVQIFGGLSGVVYGLLGFCWRLRQVDPLLQIRVPVGLYVFSGIWLLIGYIGISDVLFGVSMANHAHFGGLLAGWGLALLMVRPKPKGRDYV